MSTSILDQLVNQGPNPIEISRALEKLMHTEKLTQRELALRVGKKRSTIANYLRLLTLPEEIQTSIRKGFITMGHAKKLAGLEEKEQKKLWNAILQKKLNVRETENWTDSNNEKDISVKTLEKKLEEKLGTKVNILPQGNGGKILLHYFNLDDLDRLLALLEVHV